MYMCWCMFHLSSSPSISFLSSVFHVSPQLIPVKLFPVHTHTFHFHGNCYHITVVGFHSWVLWRSAYTTRLGSWRLRMQVPIDWMKTYFFGRDTSRFWCCYNLFFSLITYICICAGAHNELFLSLCAPDLWQDLIIGRMRAPKFNPLNDASDGGGAKQRWTVTLLGLRSPLHCRVQPEMSRARLQRVVQQAKATFSRPTSDPCFLSEFEKLKDAVRRESTCVTSIRYLLLPWKLRLRVDYFQHRLPQLY